MRFRIYTLVDVTETNARRGQEIKAVNQQANFNTLYNVIGLRTNPTEFKVSSEELPVDSFRFGSRYKGKHRVWTIEFVVEAEQSTDIDIMENDFDLVPIITGLDETAKLDKGMFVTLSNNGRTNIIFERIDK